jgi:DNA-binding transcriptional ArsR family regulator
MPDLGDGDDDGTTLRSVDVGRQVIRVWLPTLPGLIGKSQLAYHREVDDAAEPERDAAREGDVFKALADPTRRKILDELAERGGQTLFEICSRLTMKYQLGSSRQAISQHLEVLIGAGLVTSHREGRYKFHYIDTGPLQRLTDRWRNRETKEN